MKVKDLIKILQRKDPESQVFMYCRSSATSRSNYASVDGCVSYLNLSTALANVPSEFEGADSSVVLYFEEKKW